MQPADGVVTGLLVDLGQIAQGPAGPEEGLPCPHLAHVGPGEQPPHMVAQSPDLAGPRRITLQKGLAQPQRAQRQARGTSLATVAKGGHLEAAAAQVEQDAIVHGKAAESAHESVVRLAPPVDDLDRDSQLAPYAPNERGAVASLPHGGRGDGGDSLRVRPVRDGAKVAQRHHRPIDGLVADEVLLVDVMDQAKRGARAGEDAELADRLALEHHHPARVGADVDHRN
jgi:hypothetical protein